MYVYILHLIYTLFHNLLTNFRYIVNISPIIKFFQNTIFMALLGLSTFCYGKLGVSNYSYIQIFLNVHSNCFKIIPKCRLIGSWGMHIFGAFSRNCQSALQKSWATSYPPQQGTGVCAHMTPTLIIINLNVFTFQIDQKCCILLF